MKDKLLNIQEEAIDRLKKIDNLKDLDQLRINYLGKKGQLTSILKGMGKLSKEERPVMGQLANDVRSEIENNIKEIIDFRNGIIRKVLVLIWYGKDEGFRIIISIRWWTWR